MFKSHIHDLNVIEPVYLDSNSLDLLSGPQFPDPSLWVHMPFEIDDGPVFPVTNDCGLGQMTDEDGNRNGGEIEVATVHEGHLNIVVGSDWGSDYLPQNSPPATIGSPSSPLGTSCQMPSLGIDPLDLIQKRSPQGTSPSSTTSSPIDSVKSSSLVDQSTHILHTKAAPSKELQYSRDPDTSVESLSQDSSLGEPLTPPSVAKDKRRRNTAASARFRLKKKEREIALENNVKELEARVSALEKECEGLERENGWLRGLVAGVTGAVQVHSSSMSAKQTMGSEEGTP
ncbi:hypothetical protein FB446DRAFT_833532 [Lentinula raphanica]|nr:hypothetical protein FB446DRAFT_833532 [Lentinula raphanica]